MDALSVSYRVQLHLHEFITHPRLNLHLPKTQLKKMRMRNKSPDVPEWRKESNQKQIKNKIRRIHININHVDDIRWLLAFQITVALFILTSNWSRAEVGALRKARKEFWESWCLTPIDPKRITPLWSGIRASKADWNRTGHRTVSKNAEQVSYDRSNNACVCRELKTTSHICVLEQSQILFHWVNLWRNVVSMNTQLLLKTRPLSLSKDAFLKSQYFSAIL